MNKIHLVSFALLVIAIEVSCRTVPAKDDICARYPQFSLCLSNAPNAPKEAPPQPPTAPPPVEKQTLDRDTYCKKYQLHFTYFCSPGVETDATAKDFCGAYGRNCDIKDTPQAYTKDQVSAECNKKRQLAETYCTGNEPEAIKPQCDLYRQYCSNNGPSPATPNVVSQPDPLAYCTSYQQQYIAGCQSARPPTGRLPPIGTPVQSFAGGKKRRRRQSAGDIGSLCTQYSSLASQFCTGNEPAGQIKDKCNLYRQFCVNKGSPSAPQQAAVPAALVAPVVTVPPAAGSSSGSDFCTHYVQTCSNLQQLTPQNNQLQVLCSNYAYMANTFCPGYETAQSRTTCNNYRQYCMNQQPFRDIDGATNFNNGIANIPNNWGGGLLGFQG